MTAAPAATSSLQRIVARPTQTFDHIVVAVHGIGEQKHAATVRSVASRLAASASLLTPATQPVPGGTPRALPVAPQPLGHFVADPTFVPSLVDRLPLLKDTPLEKIGFAEVYWANIPQSVVQEGRTLEETKAWARTVVARARALYTEARAAKIPGIVEPDFCLASEVLEEIVDAVRVIENLTFLADKAGLGRFDVTRVLENYLGDVQIVAEFATHRQEIVGAFRSVMENYYRAEAARGNADVKLHIVAHSEGTVVSFLGLLQAMSEFPSGTSLKPDAVPEKVEWVRHVRGYMTLGSPIDKHLLLWPRLWEDLEPHRANRFIPAGQIAWRNYYDLGDPVGYELNTARCWLDLNRVDAFEFCACPDCQHDVGFARYPLPGKAHNDYWDDAEVFEHFVTDVVLQCPPEKRAPRPRSTFSGWVSQFVPYGIAAVVLAAGATILYRTVTAFTHPERDPLAALTIARDLGVKLSTSVAGMQLMWQALAVTALIAGVTIFARLPRLAAGLKWKVRGAIAFALGCVAYWQIDPGSRNEIGRIFPPIVDNAATWGVLLLGFTVSAISLWASRSRKARPEDVRKRLFRRGMRPLLIMGALGVCGIVGAQIVSHGTPPTETQAAQIERLYRPAPDATTADRESLAGKHADVLRVLREARFDASELSQLLREPGLAERLDRMLSAEPVLTSSPPVWPVVLATAAFLYLWWLAALIFDLSFVWQRYVRGSAIEERLGTWTGLRREKRRRSWKITKVENCRNRKRTANLEGGARSEK